MRTNKKFILIFIISLLLLAAIFYFSDNKDSSLADRKLLFNFQVPDTALVTKIVLSDKTPSVAVLTKKDNRTWVINESYIARKNPVNILLSTIASMKMKNFVPKSAEQNVLKNLSASATEVKIYEGEKIIKHFYVGNEPKNLLGTYMMLNGSSAAFVVHIPGFNGFLSSRFFTDEFLWRDRTFCNLNNNDIESVELQYKSEIFYKKFNESFKLLLKKDKYSLIPNTGNQFVADKRNAKLYLSFFENLQFEAYVNDMKQSVIDSIIQTPILFELLVKEKSGQEHRLQAFYKKAKKGKLDNEGNPLKHDIDAFFALINKEDFVIIQHYIFDKILVSKDNFLAHN